MGRVYAVASAKGGVGKTTTTANLGVALAAAGHRVAVVDADLGMPNLARMLGVTPTGPTLHAVLAGEATPLDAVTEGPHGLGVLPGETDLSAYAKADPRGLRSVLDALVDDGYDFVVVDTGAGLSHDTVLPLGVADAVLLVSTPSADSLGDTERTRELAERVGASVAGLVLTRVDTTRVDVDALVADLGIDLLEVVPEDQSVHEETADSGPVVVRDPDAPATAAYRALAGALAADAMDTAFDEPPVAAAGDEGPDHDDVPEAEVAGTDRASDAEDGAGEDDSFAAPDPSEHADEIDDVDVSSVLGDDSGGDLDEVLHLDDHGEGGDDTDTDETVDGGDDTDDAADVAPTGDESPTDSDSAPGSESDAEAPGGLASTLADVESGATEPVDEPADHPQDGGGEGGVVIPDAVAEAEPDGSDGVTFDAAPDPDDADVTIQPDDASAIPDAESDTRGSGSPDAGTPGGETSTDESSSDGTDDEEAEGKGAGAESEGEDEGEETGKKGLFGRFFG